MNAVSASNTGSTAAISAPNTTSSTPMASGTAVHSAWPKFVLMLLFSACWALASPVSVIVKPGLAAWARATAASTVLTCESAPRSWNRISASRPLAESRWSA